VRIGVVGFVAHGRKEFHVALNERRVEAELRKLSAGK